MDLKFPLERAPVCLYCGRSCTRGITSNSNGSGNAGRPYYTCLHSSHGRKFVCWDDDRGISSTNPRCECGLTSRQFAAKGEEYYGCPVGTCDWTIFVHDLWSDCSRIEEFFGPPIVIGFGAQDNQSHQNRRPPVKVELGADSPWKILTASDESPLCSICRMVLDKLRGSKDSLIANVSPEGARDRGSAIRTSESVYVCEYGFEEKDLGQATLYMVWKECGGGSDPLQVRHASDLGCLPSTSVSTNNAGTFRTGSFERGMTLAQQWIQRCETAHPSCRIEDGTRYIPTRVIDVGEKRIFHSLIEPVLRSQKDVPPASSYLTLSHCWGGIVPLRLMTSNLASMMERIPFDQLPKTFQDAIVVTQNLGFRYIWIDSLCIIQDDTQDWQREAALMAEIYKHGSCNLSAAGAADSSAGLFLDRDPIFTRPVKARFLTDSQGVVLHEFWPAGVLQNFEAGPLMDRGWVVQERLLSRRNIHLSRDQIVWECRIHSACETFPDKAPFKETPSFLKHSFSRVVYGEDQGPQSLTEVWSILVSKYTGCKLSYDTDKLIAFGGIASTFSGSLGKRYVAGLWLENLAYQLCWVGKRRTGQAYVAPSWSWASTEGGVNNAFLPVHPNHVVRQIEVLEAQVDLVSENPYGQLKGGYLRVAGRLTTAKIIFEDERVGLGKKTRPILRLPDGAGNYRPTRDACDNLRLSCTENDILDAQRRPSGNGVLYILAVMEHVNAETEHLQAMRGKPQMNSRRAPRTRWLILYPVANQCGTFTRWGVLTADDSSYGLFTQACRWYDQTPGHLRVHSYDEQNGGRYDVTII